MSLKFSGPTLLEWRKTGNMSPGSAHQVGFVGDNLPIACSIDRDEYTMIRERVRIVGQHTSKSVSLPVFGIEIPHLGLSAVLSNNFCDWTVSVAIPRGVDITSMRYFVFMDALDSTLCPGFEDGWVRGAYSPTATEWTVQTINTEAAVFALFHTICTQLRA